MIDSAVVESEFEEMAYLFAATEAPARDPFAALWRAVILQALTDLANRSRKMTAYTEWFKAAHWLFESKTDFEEVCDHADMHPDTVRKKATQILNEGLKWRAKAGQGKDYHRYQGKSKTRKAERYEQEEIRA